MTTESASSAIPATYYGVQPLSRNFHSATSSCLFTAIVKGHCVNGADEEPTQTQACAYGLRALPWAEKKMRRRQPSGTCSSWGYACYYATCGSRSSRHKASTSSVDASSTSPLPGASGDTGTKHSRANNPQGALRNLAANSGAAFVRKMGLKVDPANAPRLNLFGWNVGARQLTSGLISAAALPIVDIIALGDLTQLAQIYFSKVDPCYGFIDKQLFFRRLNARWQSSGRNNMYDAVLAGVAALGLLFSERTVKVMELHLVESARSILESYNGCTVQIGRAHV